MRTLAGATAQLTMALNSSRGELAIVAMADSVLTKEHTLSTARGPD
jgi:hypothetical protein